MKQNKKAVAYIRQICCSGLSKEIVIPEFLRAVESVVPSSNNTFTGLNESFDPSYFLLGFSATDMDELVPVVITKTFTSECKRRISLWAKQHSTCPISNDPTILFDESFYMSDMYNLVWRQYDQHHALYALVKQLGIPVGSLNLFRPRHQKPFDNLDQAFVNSLLPYIAHALQVAGTRNFSYFEKGASGMMIMDRQGTILYMSQEAKRLLSLAGNPLITTYFRIKETELLAKLKRLCSNLSKIFEGKNTDPPSWIFTNECGQFIFYACRLNQQDSEENFLIGMTIVHQEPLDIKILRALGFTSLSPIQKEVAALLMRDLNSEAICQHLCIKLNTVKDHVRKIFIKLNINNRKELLPLLMNETKDFAGKNCLVKQEAHTKN